MSVSYHIPQTVVKPLVKPLALTTADMNRLEAADAYYFYVGGGDWQFGQVCDEPTCRGYWTIIINETDPDFRKAIKRAIDGGPCKDCATRNAPSVKSLIQYQAKSAASGASGGGGKGKGRESDSRRTPRRKARVEYINTTATGWVIWKQGNKRYAVKDGQRIDFPTIDAMWEFVRAQERAVA